MKKGVSHAVLSPGETKNHIVRTKFKRPLNPIQQKGRRIPIALQGMATEIQRLRKQGHIVKLFAIGRRGKKKGKCWFFPHMRRDIFDTPLQYHWIPVVRSITIKPFAVKQMNISSFQTPRRASRYETVFSSKPTVSEFDPNFQYYHLKITNNGSR